MTFHIVHLLGLGCSATEKQENRRDAEKLMKRTVKIHFQKNVKINISSINGFMRYVQYIME